MKFLKTLSIFLLFLFFGITSVTAVENDPLIEYSKDKCGFCGMVVKNRNIASLIITKDGKKLPFCSIECAVGYYMNNIDNVREIKVPNFLEPSQFLDAKEAYYLKSENLKTSMGMNLSAYSSKQEAKKMQNEKGGQIYSWNELLPLIDKEFLPRFMYRNSHMGH